MVEWRPDKNDAHSSRGWAVYEYPDESATRHLRCVASGLTEKDARRIAKLPELEARLVEADACIDELYDGSDQDACDSVVVAYWNKYFPDAEEVTS